MKMTVAEHIRVHTVCVLRRFCQLRCVEYGMARLAPLIEQYCELHRVSRKDKAYLLELVMAISAD